MFVFCRAFQCPNNADSVQPVQDIDSLIVLYVLGRILSWKLNLNLPARKKVPEYVDESAVVGRE
jgi:hypothetical protein